MLSPPPPVVQQWHDSLQLIIIILKSQLNSVSQVTGQFTVSISHPVQGVRKTTARYNEILKEHLGASSSYRAVPAAGHKHLSKSRCLQREDWLLCHLQQKVLSPQPCVPQLQGNPMCTQPPRMPTHHALQETWGEQNQHYHAN